MENQKIVIAKKPKQIEYQFDFKSGLKTKAKKFLRSLLIKDYIRWDPWILKDDDVYRLFYLVGPKDTEVFWSTGTIHGAISSDLKQWQELGVILEPDLSSDWESGRMLAGSAYKEDGVYYLFYSAAGEGEPALFYEEIGLATSKDGLQWQRYSPHPRYLFSNLEERDRWYGKYKERFFFWRDPYIIKEPKDGKYYMLISAFLKAGVGSSRGCVGLAVADKMAGPYKILPPIVAPVVTEQVDESEEWPFDEMERPQVIYKDGKYHLFFSCWTNHLNPKWLQKVGKAKLSNSSVYWYISDKITGPFRPVSEKPVVKGSEKTGIYGTNFLPVPNKPEEFITYGWYPRRMILGISPLVRAYWRNNSIQIG